MLSFCKVKFTIFIRISAQHLISAHPMKCPYLKQKIGRVKVGRWKERVRAKRCDGLE